MKSLTVGLAQIYPKLGDVRANCELHLQFIERAVAQQVDLLVFPELSLTGYTLQDLVREVAMRPTAEHPAFASMLDASRRLDLVVGFAEVDERGRFFTSAAYLAQGKLAHLHRKVYLPTYAMFDEGRYFDLGESVRAFDTRFGRFGLLICEDFWHASPPYLSWLDGADVLLFTSASPGRGLGYLGKLASSRFVETVNQAYAALFGAYVIHVNRCGFEDGLNFWGGSTVFNPDGDLIAQAPYFEEALIVAQIEIDQIRRTRTRLPLLRDERPEIALRELRRILSEKA
ncbi:MAG TPA: nitrilase-related carbon-nitrogen hydrolase [Anaerolineae bacterium]|nr:nitrilase-related carbon-nitrogen hydrolase [Anaerolineae bacterium]